MRVVSAVIGGVLLTVAIWALVRLFRQRRRLRDAVVRTDLVRVPTPPPALLSEAGLDQAIALGRCEGARGVFDGVVIQALVAIERAPIGGVLAGNEIVVLGMAQPPDARRFRVSARARGLRREGRALVIGRADIDANLVVTGDPADARALLGDAAGPALMHAITVHGWRLEDGEWVRRALGASADFVGVVRAGAAAGGALLAAARASGPYRMEVP